MNDAELLKNLHHDLAEAPRVLNSSDIARMMVKFRPMMSKNASNEVEASDVSVSKVNPHVLNRILTTMSDLGVVRKVRRGLFLNKVCVPPAADAEAARFVRKGAIVSLMTVLGDAGVLNNYSRDIWAVVPMPSFLDIDATTPTTGIVRMSTTSESVYRFIGMKSDALFAPDPNDLYDSHAPGAPEYRRASHEAALVHSLYLSRSLSRRKGPKHYEAPAIHDIDLGLLDRDRLTRVAVAMGIETVLETWLSGVKEPEDEEMVAPGLNF